MQSRFSSRLIENEEHTFSLNSLRDWWNLLRPKLPVQCVKKVADLCKKRGQIFSLLFQYGYDLRFSKYKRPNLL